MELFDRAPLCIFQIKFLVGQSPLNTIPCRQIAFALLEYIDLPRSRRTWIPPDNPSLLIGKANDLPAALIAAKSCQAIFRVPGNAHLGNVTPKFHDLPT